MKILYDGQELQIPQSVRGRDQLWDYIEDKATQQGRVLIDALSDGESLNKTDFLTVPEEITVEFITATPYGLALEVLVLLSYETTELVNASRSGQLTQSAVAETFAFALQALGKMRECYPEWITADDLTDQATVIYKDATADQEVDLAAALDYWCQLLAKGIEEIELYRQADEGADQ